MRFFAVLALASLVLAAVPSVFAYYNITNTNTTVVLSTNGSAHVLEQFTLFVSNSSFENYNSNRNALNLSLSHWQNVLYTTVLHEDLIGIGHDIYGFEFLPGPLLEQTANGGIATLSLNYYISNVTNVSNIAPRKFKYSFNDSLFNFESTANGQVLPTNTRFNIVIPSGAELVSVYPSPDMPKPDALGNYANATIFSWDSGELLSSFTFSYVTTQSLQDEVLAYLKGIYAEYALAIYFAIIVAVVLIAAYVYTLNKRNR